MEILGVLLALRRDGQDDDDVVVQDFPVYTPGPEQKKVWCRKNCVGNVPNGFVWGFGFG